MKSIPLLLDNDALYINHNLRDSSSAAISRLKHVLLQQIFGFSDSHASYLNTRKDEIRIRMNIIIQSVIFVVLFMRTFYVVNICLVVISTVDEIHFCFLM
jgi:hypothetical protein